MKPEEAASVVQLNLDSIQRGVCKGMMEDLMLRGPYKHPNGTLIVHVDFPRACGGLTDYVGVGYDGHGGGSSHR